MRFTRPRPRGSLAAHHGFSLVEVLVAIGLLATAIVSLAHLFAAATRANREAGDTTWATVLAAQKIEELRSEPFSEPLTAQSVDYVDVEGNRLDDPGSTRRAYTRRWWVEPLPSAPDDTVSITVVVSQYRGAGDTPDAAVGPWDAVRLVTLRTRKAP